jgi:hypothetical protein
MLHLRRLTAQGLEEMHDLLDVVASRGDADHVALRDHSQLTEVISDTPVFEVRPFRSRFEFAQYASQMLDHVAWRVTDVDRDRGLWSWMALAMIDELAPVAQDGSRRLGERSRWILVTEDYRRYYRHLLASPYRIYRTHWENPERAMALLATPLDRPGEVVEQFASRQEIVSNPQLQELITLLYYDRSSRSLRRGAGGKGSGSSRRLADVLAQLDMTWDIYGMGADQLVALLPEEFERFVPVGRADNTDAGPTSA